MALDFTALQGLKEDKKQRDQAAEQQEDIKKTYSTRKLEQQADYVAECKRIYQEHQEARKKSQCLQWEIMKGVNAGEDIKDLFIKAVKTISLMTGTEVFYTQIKRQIKEKY